ncbi:SRP72 RNA-binding domain-containing protein [Ditylenchus destructor]|nr:SRP72 RNA-binding domain-containing protein [Ditylenchus destructor]
MPPKRKKPKMELRSGDEIFEQAYIFYRRNMNREALREIKKGDQNEVRFMELKAQLLYRLERGEEALELFEKIISMHSDDYDDTRRANLMAVMALLESKKQGDLVNSSALCNELDQSPETFEQIYNHACRLVNQDRYAEALKHLDVAIEKCRETLTEDGCSPKEIEEELAVIRVQKAFVLQRLNATEEAKSMYRKLQEANVLDSNLKAVTFNNLIVEHESNATNPQAEMRLITENTKYKLSQIQKHIMQFNLALMKLQPAENKESFQEFVTGKLKKRKKKKKPKLPKNYDPNVTPDPERWLPRQERTAYKKRLNKKFKDRDIGRGTQGAASGSQSATNIDYSKAASAEPQPSPKPTPGGPEGPRQQRPGAQQAKKPKKKKGGKW